jgi:hypothetical protein
MTSTSNKNTQGNYNHEQQMNNTIGTYLTYLHSAQAYTNHLPGDGLLPGRVSRSQLCNNYCDVESQLFGIGSTNLVNPAPIVQPDLRNLSSLSVIDRLPVITPGPLVIEPNQRPYLLK